MLQNLPSFDLVVATIGRDVELGRLLDSLEAQTHAGFRTIVVDQNPNDRLSSVLSGRKLDLRRLASDRGLSRARNATFDLLAADIVAFPDDDSVYPPDLLEVVGRRFAADPILDGLSVRVADGSGASDAGWGHEPVRLTRENVWNLVASAGLFLRQSMVHTVGRFDEEMGVGSSRLWASGEETDYVIRALEQGARIDYDPAIVVEHELRSQDDDALPAQGLREGASVGYLLGKHDYSLRMLGRMAVRPVGGAVVSLAHLDIGRARFHAATLRGRVNGYLGARRSKISA